MAIKKNSNRLFSNRSGYLSKSWLYCRWVLYTLFVLSIGNIYYLLLGGDYFTLAVFILVAFLTTFFSKNMVVILCISLVISTILKSVQVKEGLELSNNDLNTIEKVIGKLGGGVKEGNKSKDDSDSSDKKDSSDKSTDSSEKKNSSEKKDSSDKSTDSKKKDSDSKKEDSSDDKKSKKKDSSSD